MTTEPDDGTKPEPEESGSALRKKLETALAENAKLTAENIGFKAQNLINEKGYKLITVEDLKEVGSEDLAKTAEALEAQREKQGKDAFRKSLEARGLTGDDLEEMVTAVFSETEGEASLQALERIRAAGNTPGTKVADVIDNTLSGPALINEALKPKKK